MADSSLKAHWFYILLALAHGDRHGLAIAREVQALSDGRVRLWPATLYGSLDELRQRRWIEELSDARERPQESERKRYYRLTRAGRLVLTAEAEHLGRVARLARSRVRPSPGTVE
jgi:DNA-binding PadR family transcriptional regulator